MDEDEIETFLKLIKAILPTKPFLVNVSSAELEISIPKWVQNRAFIMRHSKGWTLALTEDECREYLRGR
jgi:hypothetical protein